MKGHILSLLLIVNPYFENKRKKIDCKYNCTCLKTND